MSRSSPCCVTLLGGGGWWHRGQGHLYHRSIAPWRCGVPAGVCGVLVPGDRSSRRRHEHPWGQWATRGLILPHGMPAALGRAAHVP